MEQAICRMGPARFAPLKMSRADLAKAAAVACAAAISMNGVMAYLTATDSAINNFSIANSALYADSIHVVEEHWNTDDGNANGIPDAAENLAPGQTVAKDPSIKNDSTIESYAVIKVDVPTMSVMLSGEAAAAMHELFSYTVNSGWTESGTGVYNAETNMTTHTYLYSGKLAANSSTATLFDSVTFANLANGQLSGEALRQSINVTGYAIQALGFDSVDQAWAAYQNQHA